MPENSFRILQIGGNRLVRQAINAGLRRAAHSAVLFRESEEDLIPSGSDSLFGDNDLRGIFEAKYDLILFEDSPSLTAFLQASAAFDGQTTLKRQKSAGLKLFLYLNQLRTLTSPDPVIPAECGAYLDHIFFSQTSELAAFEGCASRSWLALPLDLQVTPKPKIEEPPAHQIKILQCCEEGNIEPSEQIQAIFSRLAEKKLKFEQRALNLNQIGNFSQLLLQLADCNVLIESVDAEIYGPLAALGLALGKTVLSGKRANMRRYWDQLEFSPVLDTNIESLPARLESILREPKCLRDLAKRGREFAEKNHNTDVLMQLLLAKHANGVKPIF